MKAIRYFAVLAIGIGFSQLAFAQAPAAVPAGSTGMCKDGSYTTAASKSGACRGHKGVQTWFSAVDSAKPKAGKAAAKTSAEPSASTPAPAAASPVPAAPASSTNTTAGTAKAPASSTSTMAQAPGGGAGLVWVNTATNVYHCSGTRFYGKTKAGKYMTEAQAKTAGAHADHGKGCGQ